MIKHWINNLNTYEPGKPIQELARELGFDNIESIIKVASNENEFGPSPKAIKAIKLAINNINRYPDGGCFYLKEKLSDFLGIHEDQILFGNGSNELIVFLAHLFLEPGKSLIMSEHGFAVYALATKLYQGDLIKIPMKNFTHDLDEMLNAITEDTQIIVVVNPNNPTGTSVDPSKLENFIKNIPKDVLCVIDEAYLEVMPKNKQINILPFIEDNNDNLIVLRTFSKGYGLSGLRIGYALGSKVLINQLNKVRQPFNVNSLAQAAAIAALDDVQYIETVRSLTICGIEFLESEFKKIGIETIPSSANFILVKTGNGRDIFEKLKKQKIIVRPMDVYSLPEYIRITVGTEKQNKAIIKAFKNIF